MGRTIIRKEMSQGNARWLRETFNEDAERYERARPSYPDEVFVDLQRLTGIGPAVGS
jgi:hypothetical protein